MTRPDAVPNDPAIEALDEEIASLNAEIDERARRQETDVTVRNRLLAVRATLVRKVRPRKPRVVAEAVSEIPVEEDAAWSPPS
jgi:hypothetical protein